MPLVIRLSKVSTWYVAVHVPFFPFRASFSVQGTLSAKPNKPLGKQPAFPLLTGFSAIITTTIGEGQPPEPPFQKKLQYTFPLLTPAPEPYVIIGNPVEFIETSKPQLW